MQMQSLLTDSAVWAGLTTIVLGVIFLVWAVHALVDHWRRHPENRGVMFGIGVVLLGVFLSNIVRHPIPAQQSPNPFAVSHQITDGESPHAGTRHFVNGMDLPSHTASQDLKSTVPRWFVQNFGARGSSILLVVIGVAILIRLGRGIKLRTSAVAAPTSSRSAVWLIVPACCLGGLSYLALPALSSLEDHELPRKSEALKAQQLHTEKVLRELRDGSTTTSSNSTPIPDWLKNGVVTSSQFILSSGQFTSPQEAENQLLPHAAYLLQRAFQESHPWEGAWTVPSIEIRERVVDQIFVEKLSKTIGKFSGDLYRVHLRVDVSPGVCETFTSEWKSQIVRHRLEVLGVLLAWVTSFLVVATLYFRRASHPENFVGWWGQLKASTVTVGLTAAAAWVLVDVIR